MFDLSALKGKIGGWFGSNPAAGGPLQAAAGASNPVSPFGMGNAAQAFKQATFAPTGMQKFGQGVSRFLQDPNAQMGLAMLAARQNGGMDQNMMQQMLMQRMMQGRGPLGGGV